MKTTRTLLIALMALFAITACDDAATDLGTGTTLPNVGDVADNPELEAAAERVQTEMEELGAEIENSEAADELQDEWAQLRTEIDAAIDSVTSDGQVDMTGLETAMDDFQSDLEAAGDELGDEVMAAWTALRTQIIELTN